MKKIGIASIFLALVITFVACDGGAESTTEASQQQIANQDVPTQPEAEIPVTSEIAEEKAAIPAEDISTSPATTDEKTTKPTSKPEPTKSKPVVKTSTKPKPVVKKETTTPTPKPVEKEVKTIPKHTKKEIPKTKVPKKEIPKPSTKPSKPALNHAIFDGLLRKYVTSSGKVNYKGFKSEEKTLDAYLKLLSDNSNQMGWSRNKKMAYWINAYNAGTVKLILKNYPTSSITKLEGGKPWDKSWIKLGNATYSLDQIENKILRPKFNDPRIHFAVNCAAKSCPKLLNRAWTESNLESNFEKQTRSFVNSSFNKIEKDKVELSKIFEWYKADFGDLIDFLNTYSNTKIDRKATISYSEYNWELNE